jgi:putative monooxygenase
MSEKAPREGKVVDPDTAPRRDMQLERGYAIQLVDPNLGAERLDMHINVLKAGGAPGPYHLHTNCENIYFILVGDVVVTIDGVPHQMKPGMAVFIPPNVPHSASNVGDTEARLVEIYTPPGQDFVHVEKEG